MRFKLPRHLVENTTQNGDFIITLFFRHPRIKIALTNPRCRRRQSPDRTRKAFGKPQSQPDCRQDQDDRKAKIQQSEFEQHPAPFGLQLVVKQDSFLSVVQQAEYLAIHIARDINQTVKIAVNHDQSAKLVLRPIPYDHNVAFQRAIYFLCGRLLVIKKIRAIPPRLNFTGTVDHIGLSQAPLDL